MNQVEELALYSKLARSKLRREYTVDIVLKLFGDEGWYIKFGPHDRVEYIRNHPEDSDAVFEYIESKINYN
jgi:hypothetical protein